MCGLHHSGGVADAQPPATGFYPFRMLITQGIPQYLTALSGDGEPMPA